MRVDNARINVCYLSPSNKIHSWLT
jgi:hypothetical protein